MTQTKPPSPPLSVTSIILSMGLLAVGNGLLYAYIPVQLAAAGFAPWLAGAVVTSMAGGGLIACLVTGQAVQRVGHARAFATMTACVILSILIIALDARPGIWIAARALYGFASTGLFIISQSWLNDACVNEWRGKVISLFYMVYIIAIGCGGFVLRWVTLDSGIVPLLSIAFTALALLPVSLTRLPTPPPPASISIAIRSVWKVSPVALIGLFAAGGLTMLLQGFAPIYVSAAGYSKDQVGLLIFLMQLGLIVVQYPLGALSDRIDRRYVVVATCMLMIVTAVFATQIGVENFWAVVIIFAVWTGATESVYSIANAHANDRANAKDYVSLSSTLLVAWSISALVIPGLATALTPVFGAKVFMYLSMLIAVLYGGFVAYRVLQREPTPSEDVEPYQQVSALVPLTNELFSHPAEAADKNRLFE